MELKTLATKEFAIKGGNANRLTCEVYYSKGGQNVFTGRTEPRGYYFSITPEQVNGNVISYAGFSGSKGLMFETDRRTKSGEEKAVGQFQEYIDRYLEPFMERHGYTFSD